MISNACFYITEYNRFFSSNNWPITHKFCALNAYYMHIEAIVEIKNFYQYFKSYLLITKEKNIAILCILETVNDFIFFY